MASNPSAKLPPGLEWKNGNIQPAPVIPLGQESVTGLQHEFPAVPAHPDNPTTPKRVELGRLLFFDPVLSGNNKISCAHCHHPDLGLSDGLPRALGFGSSGLGAARKGGKKLSRRTPSLWNAFYNRRQFWDGRAKALEEQAGFPITNPKEMGGKREEVERKLRNIPEYHRLFTHAFGNISGEPITFRNVTKALAAFERTLISQNSRFDRYAAGEKEALSSVEKTGLKMFLSTHLRCVECHGLPTFANPEFKVIGVPDPKDGDPDKPDPKAEIGHGGGPKGAYKIPSLRNVALHAPYMHNGTLATLNDVLDFYEKGGGSGTGLNILWQDDKIRGLHFLPGEQETLSAFLESLTDISALPEIPRRVPSGLPVVPHLSKSPIAPLNKGDHSLRSKATEQVASSPEALLPPPAPNPKSQTVEVHPLESIQQAVERVGRNGKVRVYPGIYYESVLVIDHDVTLEGVVQNDRRPILNGRGSLMEAVVVVGNRCTVQGFGIQNYRGSGVTAYGAKQLLCRDLNIRSSGVFGISPIECNGVIIENCTISDSNDAGLYVGQSKNTVVHGNKIVRSTAGIEIENSVHTLLENNDIHDNSSGILVLALPFNRSKLAEDCKIAHNRVWNNNLRGVADSNAFLKNVSKGSGITVLAADRTEITDNEIFGNQTYGISIASLQSGYSPGRRLDIDPHPDGSRIYGNRLRENGVTPALEPKRPNVLRRDLLWDGSGADNRWDQPGVSSFPDPLPKLKPSSTD